MDADGAPLLEFYMYRAGNELVPFSTSDSMRSANFANAAGVLRYIHNEVVGRRVVGTAAPPICERKYNISQIYRYKVAMRSTPEAIARHSSGFLGFVAIDYAQCTVPQCDDVWWKPYGYVPGCQDQNVDAFKYADALWYSFPGKCPSKTYEEPCGEQEEALEPGGACRPSLAGTADMRVPDGARDCTYVYEPAGKISVDELVGIKKLYGDYTHFCSQGGVEFNGPLNDDAGITLDFWKDYNDVERNKQRTSALLALFKYKYPDSPDLDDPSCSTSFVRPSYWPGGADAVSADTARHLDLQPPPQALAPPPPALAPALPAAPAAQVPPEVAPVLNFYMYRAGSADFPPAVSDAQRSANFANAAGVLRYIHNEVVGRRVVGTAAPPLCERKYNITEIYRYKVTMRSTPEAIKRHSSGFLGFVAIDKAQCTVPQCEETWWKPYGYVPGCQDQSIEAFKYADALWYSFPGKCPSKTYEDTCSEKEEALEPGGACRPSSLDGTPRTPDGTRDCTYIYEPAGRVSIDELVGIQQQFGDYKHFCNQGGVEFNGPHNSDEGITLDFWREYNDVEKNKKRTSALLALFKHKYPDSPELDDPGCSRPFARPSYWPGGDDAVSDAVALHLDVSPQVPIDFEKQPDDVTPTPVPETPAPAPATDTVTPAPATDTVTPAPSPQPSAASWRFRNLGITMVAAWLLPSMAA